MSQTDNMSMPTELSKYIHDFLRGDLMTRAVYKARRKWIQRNASNNFKLGQEFKTSDHILKVVKITACMVSFQTQTGEIYRCKPKFEKAHSFWVESCGPNDTGEIKIPNRYVATIKLPSIYSTVPVKNTITMENIYSL